MAKFKVGDRVRAVGETAIIERGREYTVAEATFYAPLHHVFVHTGTSHGVLNYTDDMFELVEPVAVAHATATLQIEAGKYYKTRDGRKVGPMEHWNFYNEQFFHAPSSELNGEYWQKNGVNSEPHIGQDRDLDLIAEWVDEPAITTPPHVTLGIDLSPPTAPQVGDAVLIKGTLAGITTSHRGTNYNIVFETQNRRVSLHFLEEDFILDDRDCGPDCAFATNDNGPVPSTDTAKAFDALGSWMNSLAVSRAA
ncbi:hypothetical protein [Bosea sp. AS-1]|uniref:hypothetical protein n=1 Tax=Bosea sp. AS-1 TaxID=2015316 RepID=UPI0012FD743F|nr:hypothetical protein [Bosea sp. AS-1]